MDLLSVDEAARTLNMHPRTVRRLLREGKLTGAKVGGEWRISADSLHPHLTNEGVKQATTEQLEAISAGTLLRPGERVGACIVVDIHVRSPDAMAPLTSLVIDQINRCASPGGPLKFTYYYDQAIRTARFAFWGHPRFLATILATIGDHDL